MPARATLLAALLLAAGCTPPPPTSASRANAAAIASCRSSTDQSFNRQNRYLLSERPSTDLPFSDSGNSGITTRGLTQQYDYGTALQSCLAASRSPGPADSPASSPEPIPGPTTPGANSRAQPF